jgi:enamine deaminase RidA (YjgF/YER057c/UK114 family)
MRAAVKGPPYRAHLSPIRRLRGSVARSLRDPVRLVASQSRRHRASWLRTAGGGDLGRVRRVVSVRGFVNVAPGFTSIPEVIDGASRLLVEVFGPERGRHARTAIGAAELPSDVAVEVDAVFEVGGA